MDEALQHLAEEPRLAGHRLALEPQRVEHAEELAPLLDDVRLHAFTGGRPATVPDLRDRYRRQAARRSPDGSQRWLNWVARRCEDGQAVGTAQATVTQHQHGLTAEVAWVVASPHQGHGYAREAAGTMVTWLREQGVSTIVAHVHPGHGRPTASRAPSGSPPRGRSSTERSAGRAEGPAGKLHARRRMCHGEEVPASSGHVRRPRDRSAPWPERGSPVDDDLLTVARGGDEEAFAQLVEPHRRELLAHGYRMLGSSTDAEDALQDALLAAWRAMPAFEGRGSLRTWLFRITTNACLRLASERPPRMLSPDHGPARSDVHDLVEPVPGPVRLEPIVNEGPAADEDLDPVTAVLRRESVELAFVAALQHLPATQRAVLLLRDVLAFSAAETAAALGTSVASANSALQRARATLAERRPGRSQQTGLAALGEAGRQLVAAFVAAWERADVPTLVELLSADARFTVPPLPAWFDGRADVARFHAERVFSAPWRLLPVEVNAQVAFGCYRSDGSAWRLGAVNVLAVRDGQVSWTLGFVDPAALRTFGVPAELPPQDR